MTASLVFKILIGIIIINFIKEEVLSFLNAKHFNDKLPEELQDVYDEKAYRKSQDYKKTNYDFSFYTNSFSIILTLSLFFFEGFAWIDTLVRGVANNEILQTLIYFAILFFGSDILNTPFAFYKTFIIEEKFGFNKSTKRLFILDKLKGWALALLVGGPLLALITWFYQQTENQFWIYTWGVITIFTLFMNLFYSSLIVPLFNKQTPLEDGELKTELENFANKIGFQLDKIFVIDGSKRSTKANAYFSGFGFKKRIVLYDTLIKELSTQEIVAVFAHEVGHYKKKHIIFNLITSIVLTGLTLFILSLLIGNPLLSDALRIDEPSFHIGLITFSILYSPISEITGLAMNSISRTFEYQADNYAKKYTNAEDLISSLKKLSKNSLSNLTPHKATVFAHYSHPTLLQRIRSLRK
ncbi:M48 family metallopeptidase [Flavicella sp.]|uniref:M48 family metallopeptidase n=1 Tax=Flavicella sp. TaxID=2957742 RepID=UPI00260AD196|nr:M48 family metallopeptidase [Flavicella sp.]MDG1804912.1 M48 family metallopeptidase [Flavicella sp.]